MKSRKGWYRLNNIYINKVIDSIKESYLEVIKSNIISDNEAYQNRKRSSKFIEIMTNKLAQNKNDLCSYNNVNVFSRPAKYDRDLKLNEFLFDIHVCKMNTVKSINYKYDIKYIEKSLIEIESELNKNDLKEVIKDFEKLVCGNSPLKIMIISKYDNNKPIIEILSDIGKNISESAYLIEIDHPSDWCVDKYENNYFSVYEYDKEKNMFSHELSI